MSFPPGEISPIFSHGPVASIRGPAKDLPFEARFEEIQTVGDEEKEERATGAVYRDRQGRVRREFQVRHRSNETFEIILIVDYTDRTAVALDVAAKVATKFTGIGPPPGPWPGSGGWSFRGPWLLDSTAEERTIEGVACRKLKPVAWSLGSAAEPRISGEIWISDEIKFSVLEEVREENRKHYWRLFDIRRVEPPSSLFEIPADYKVIARSKFDPAPPEQ